MDKIEGITACTVTICCAIVFSVLVIVGAECTKHTETKKAEVRQSMLKQVKEGTIIVIDRP